MLLGKSPGPSSAAEKSITAPSASWPPEAEVARAAEKAGAALNGILTGALVVEAVKLLAWADFCRRLPVKGLLQASFPLPGRGVVYAFADLALAWPLDEKGGPFLPSGEDASLFSGFSRLTAFLIGRLLDHFRPLDNGGEPAVEVAPAAWRRWPAEKVSLTPELDNDLSYVIEWRRPAPERSEGRLFLLFSPKTLTARESVESGLAGEKHAAGEQVPSLPAAVGGAQATGDRPELAAVAEIPLPITLCFPAGSVSVVAAAAWQKGSLLHFKLPASAAIAVQANGFTFAYGELVGKEVLDLVLKITALRGPTP